MYHFFLQRVSFQCVIMSDDETTFAIFTYAQGGMNFDAGRKRQVAVGWSGQFFGATLLDFNNIDKVPGNTSKCY